jgi:hypothetical protein
MNRANAILTMAAVVLAFSLPSWAQDIKQLTNTVNVSGTVETIDHDKRSIYIKTADGFQAISVPQSAKRFDELKVGDKVSVTYNNTVYVRLKPPGEAAVDTGSKTSTMGQEAQPGGTTYVERTITATVAAIDAGASSITFVGPAGWKYSRRVVDPTVFDKLKVGDQVDITWNTDVTVAAD